MCHRHPSPLHTAPCTGQQLAAANIINDCLNFATVLQTTSAECLSTDLKARGRIECLPVQWRRQLNLEVRRVWTAACLSGVASLTSLWLTGCAMRSKGLVKVNMTNVTQPHTLTCAIHAYSARRLDVCDMRRWTDWQRSSSQPTSTPYGKWRMPQS